MILYENRCASIASESGIPRPPKKKKLIRDEFLLLMRSEADLATHKKGIHIKFSRKAHTMFFSPNRYCSNV